MERDALMYFAMWHARCEILRHATKRSCILSGKILCDLYAQLGIRAMPLAVDVIAANEIALQKEQSGEGFDPEDENEPAFAARCMVVPGGGDPDSNAWLAHLVVLADGKYICDISADQFSFPDKGIIVKPSMFAFEDSDQLEAWLYGAHERRGVNLPGGGFLSYEAHPEETSYTESPDWIDSKKGDGLWESVMTKTTGLIDLYEDVEGLPDLPDLPVGRSSDPSVSMIEDLESMKELGYSIGDLARREQAEQLRSAERRGRRIHDRIEELGSPFR